MINLVALIASSLLTALPADERDLTSKPQAAVSNAPPPIEAMRSLEAAIQNGDEVTIRRLTTTKTARQRRVYDMYVQGWAREVAFHKAVKDRFGEEGIKHFFQLGWPFVWSWIDLDEAKVEIDGDTSVVSSGPDHKHRQKLFREDGQWKVFFADWDERIMDHLEKWDLLGLADTMRVLTPKIRAGKYRTLDELGLEFRRLWGVDQSGQRGRR